MRIASLLIALLFIARSTEAGILPTNLKCEYLTDPQGIDIPDPRFYWQVSSPENGQHQTAYHLVVAADLTSLNEGRDNVFDTQKVDGRQTTHIVYQGQALKSATTYYWKVKVWDKHKQASQWSAPARFTTGLLQDADWQNAQWIAWRPQDLWEKAWRERKQRELAQKKVSLPSYFGDRMTMWERLDFHRDNPYDPAPLLRREFRARKSIKQAQAFISGIGYYELYLNGQRVGDRVLDPGWTDYRKSLLYATYDVTEHLKPGNNAVGVMLGRGHYGQTAIDHWGFYTEGGYIGQPKLKCLVRVTYADGTVENIITDRNWKVTGGPVVFDCPHMGEVYDATLEIKDWSQPGLDETKWDQVEVSPAPGGKLISQLCEPIRVVRTLKPVKLEQRNPGEHWIDAGTNLAGWLRVKVNAPKGTRLLFYFGEKPDLMDYDQPAHYQQMGYIAKGEPGEIAECRFTYKGFRYALIKGHDQPLTLNEIDVCQVNTDVNPVGRFACDNQTLNAIHGLCVRALVANLHSVPTDCPHREKNGWMGDAVTGGEFGMANYDLAAFITKFTRDMFDTQDEQGRLSVIAPNNNYNLGTSPLWSSACVHLPWYMYTYYGDTRLFETYWEQMMAYTRSVWAHRSMKEHPGLFHDVLSDWSSPFGNRPDEGSEVYSSMNFYRVLKRLAHMGKLLDKQADVVLLDKQAEQIRAAIYRHCFDPEQKIFKGLKPTDYRQGPNALALHYDIVMPEHRQAVQQRLIRDIRVDRENHIYGGIFTGLALWDLLPESGQAELAYDVAVNDTYPGYGFMLENGATTLWEHWPDSSSHIHYFLGFVDNFFYRYVAGVNINEQNPGFSEILFTPKLLSRLEHASANYQSIQGPVAISWQRTGRDVEIRVTVPCNSRGKLILPEDVYADPGKTIVLESGTHRILCKVAADAPSAKSAQRADNKESPSFQEVISGTSLRKQFADPPAEFRLVVNSTPSQEYVNEGHAGALLLDGEFPSEKKQGLMDQSWMTNPELFKKLSRQISEAKEKGYKVWFYDEMGYPSCSAGGRVTEGHPELQAQMLRYRSFASSGDELTVKPEGKVVLCAAFPVQDGTIDMESKVVFTEKAMQGTFKWKPPAGEWKLCLYEWVPAEAWKFHDQSRPMGNIMDRRATARFVELTHKKLKQELGDQVKDIFLFFTDEPQFNNVEYWIEPTRQSVPPAVPWAEELPGAFEAKYGYPIVDALPALFDKAGARTGHYRHDFYDVTSDLVAKNYWGQIQDWCHANGTYSSGHMLLEETLLYAVMFSGSLVKNWERADLPGVDLLQLPKYQTMMGDLVIGKEGFACKMASSVATFRNKPGVFSETYAVCGKVQPEEGHLSAAKGVAAWQYQQGITHMVTFSLQNVLNKSEYIQMADFAGRLALLCRRGRPVSDVAVLIPEASSWAFYNPPDGGPAKRYWQSNPDVEQIDTIFNDTCFALSSSQIDFEMLSERLLQQAVIKQGRLHLGDQSFAVLMLPESRMLSVASIRKIEAFVREKGRVVFVGKLPYMSPPKGMDADIQKAAEGLLDAKGVLHVVKTEQLPSAVDWIEREVPPEIVWQGENVVRLAHQREKNRDIMMIANPSLTDASGKLACRFTGNASVWNPEDGSVTDIGPVKSGVGIGISIPRNSARFVVIE